MKIPETLRIGGIEYKVNQTAKLNDGEKVLWGLADSGTNTININKNLNHQQASVVLWHEALHVLFQQASVNPLDEEKIVSVLAHGIYQILQDNGKRLFDIKEA